MAQVWDLEGNGWLTDCKKITGGEGLRTQWWLTPRSRETSVFLGYGSGWLCSKAR